MRRPNLAWAGLASLAVVAIGCAGKVPPASSDSEAAPPSLGSPRPDSAGAKAGQQVPPPATAVDSTPKPVLIPDSTGPEPRPSILVEKHDMKAVRTRMIPRVMGRGWTLSVNKNDSIEFLRNADPELTALLFRSPPVPASRIRLRFRLKQEKSGVAITSVAHLVGAAVYPYRAVPAVLEENLTDLRTFLMTAPSSMAPIIDRVDKKKKR